MIKTEISKVSSNDQLAQDNFMNFFDTITELIFILDMEGKIIHVNKTTELRTGYLEHELTNQSVLMMHPQERREEANRNVVEMLKGDREFCPIPLITKTGTYIPVETRVCLGRWNGSPALFGVCKDISELQLSEEKYSKAFNNSPSLMAISSLVDDKLFEVNQTFCDVLGYKKEQVLGKTTTEIGLFVNPQDRVKALVQMRTGANINKLLVEVKGKNGRKCTGLFNADKIFIADKQYLLTTMHDITEIVKMEKEMQVYNSALEELIAQKIEKIEHMSLHDGLTGLGNQSKVNLKCETQERANYIIGNKSAIYIKMDRYKYMQELIGQKELDIEILDMASELERIIGRWGELFKVEADTFLALVNSNSEEFVVEMAKKAVKALKTQIKGSKRPFNINSSIGIGTGQYEDNLATTIKKARMALHYSLKYEKTYAVFNENMKNDGARELRLEHDMREALQHGQFELYFQPIFDVKKTTINQVEVLLRWNHPELGQISPTEFIPIAERTKLIIPITDWIMSEVCVQISEWKKLGIDGIVVSINLTMLSFENRGDIFLDYVTQQVEQSGTPASCIKFEITESTFLKDADATNEIFEKLKEKGFKLAMDDFGVGYSTFESLLSLPIDIIKLDRSLIRNLANCEKYQTIFASLISMIHGLNMKVVVEGVETQEQFSDVVHYGCDYIQGFLFSKPLPNAEFVKYYFETKNTKHWF